MYLKLSIKFMLFILVYLSFAMVMFPIFVNSFVSKLPI